MLSNRRNDESVKYNEAMMEVDAKIKTIARATERNVN